MSENDKTFLGLDLSTQQLKGAVVDENLRIICEETVIFDTHLPEYRTNGGVTVNKSNPHEITAPTIMWVKALDLLMDKLTVASVDFSKIVAISGTAQMELWSFHYSTVFHLKSQEDAWRLKSLPHFDGRGATDEFLAERNIYVSHFHQQHGSVYWQNGAEKTLENLDPSNFLHSQLATSFSIANSPTWMDSTTKIECKCLEDAVGGPENLAEITGSRAYERFTGSQIARIVVHRPEAYRNTERISIVSSFLASLFLGKIAPIDYSDGSGMNLMDIKKKKWDQRLLDTCGPNLAEKLKDPVPSCSCLGTVSSYFVERYGFNDNCKVIACSGDNPSSLIGMGLKKEWLGVSLGTSDTLFLWVSNPKTVLNGHILCNPLDQHAFMAMLVFKNGSLTREKIRNKYAHQSWDEFSELLERTPRGNFGYIGLHFDVEEILPVAIGEHRFNKEGKKLTKYSSNEIEIRASIEGQFLTRRLFAEDIGFQIGEGTKILATGGGSANRAILQVLSDVFGCPVYTQDIVNSAMMGAACQAKIGFTGNSEIISDLPPPKLVCEPYKNSEEIYKPMVLKMREILRNITS